MSPHPGPISQTCLDMALANVTRVEVITPDGRQLALHGVKLNTSLQDDHKTLKIFVTFPGGE